MESKPKEVWKRLLESKDINADIDRIFDDQKLRELQAIIGPNARKWSVRRATHSIIGTYVWTRFFFPDRPAGEAEWSRMVRFAEAAERFSREVSGLKRNGNADKRLVIELLDRTQKRETPQEEAIFELSRTSGPNYILAHIQQLVDQLSISARRNASVASGAHEEELRQDYLSKAGWLTETTDKRNVDKFCLNEAIKRLAKFWRIAGGGSFSAGKYYPEQAQFIGSSNQAAHLILREIDPNITQRKIATAIRDHNERS